MSLPDAREDGTCCDCGEKPAETRDGRFCKRCLRRRLKEDNPIPKPTSDQRGRPARDTKTLGGTTDMTPTGGDDD